MFNKFRVQTVFRAPNLVRPFAQIQWYGKQHGLPRRHICMSWGKPELSNPPRI